MTSMHELEAVLEAVLFATPEPVPVDRLLGMFDEAERERAAAALHNVRERYRPEEEESARGIVLDEVAGGLRLVTRPDLNPYLRKFFDLHGRNKLSMAALETLAIVAYRQAVTLPEVQELRGRSSAAVVKTLLERRLIRIAGQRQVVGKPFEYTTTKDFLLHFGLQSLRDLPPLEQFEETFLADGDFSGIAGTAGDREEAFQLELAAAEAAEPAAAGGGTEPE